MTEPLLPSNSGIAPPARGDWVEFYGVREMSMNEGSIDRVDDDDALVHETPRRGASVPQVDGHRAPPISTLSHRAEMLLASLPSGFRLHETRLLFPHVLDRIAAAWHDPKQLLRTIDECMLDERGGRQGFPFGVLREISALREHYFTQVHPELRSLIDRGGAWTRG